MTPKWWNDIWLNEAFATWMSYKTMHAYDPDGGFDRSPIQRGIGAMGADSLASARQIRNPINANGDILSAFDGITYSKGAMSFQCSRTISAKMRSAMVSVCI